MNDDLISRQMVLRCIKESRDNINWRQSEDDDAFLHYTGALYRTIANEEYLPSAETEIIHCKDCKYMTEHYDTDGNAPYWTCSEWDSGTDYDGFCHYAKKKKTVDDLISRQAAIDALTKENLFKHMDTVSDGGQENRAAIRIIKCLPPAEPLTDAEQEIFLKAMSREEEVCKIVDEVYEDEGYKLNLVHVCQEIIRKVKGALWT